jgi:hypothetical protein
MEWVIVEILQDCRRGAGGSFAIAEGKCGTEMTFTLARRSMNLAENPPGCKIGALTVGRGQWSVVLGPWTREEKEQLTGSARFSTLNSVQIS